MTLREIMKYIESEFSIINKTPCDICGGSYLTKDLSINLLDSIPYDICDCICSNCGHKKIFKFYAPFIDESKKKIIQNNKLNIYKNITVYISQVI